MPHLLDGLNPNGPEKGAVLVIMHEKRASIYCLQVSEHTIEFNGMGITIPVYEQVLSAFTGAELERVAKQNPDKQIYAITNPKLGSGRNTRMAAIKILPGDIPHIQEAQCSTGPKDCIEIGESLYFQVDSAKLPCFNVNDKALSQSLDLYIPQAEKLKIEKQKARELAA